MQGECTTNVDGRGGGVHVYVILCCRGVGLWWCGCKGGLSRGVYGESLEMAGGCLEEDVLSVLLRHSGEKAVDSILET